jgi:hypothetical protein
MNCCRTISSSRILYPLCAVLILLFPAILAAQSGKTPSGSTAPASTSGLSGLSFAAGSWNKQMPKGKDLVMLCYAMKQAQSASMPFTLEPIYSIDKDENQDRPDCKRVDVNHPLLQRQTVILVIDARKAGNGMSRIRVLNFNLTATAASPINPAPLRPSISTADIAVQSGASTSVYYFPWPVQLTGDTQPSLSVNVVYVGPAPGDPFSQDTLYPAGSVVTPVLPDGHYYTSLIEGRSGTTDPAFQPATPARTPDPANPGSAQLTWMDLGTGILPGVPATSVTSWSPGKQFVPGTVILNPINAHYYVVTVGGFSGNAMPPFPTSNQATVSETVGAVSWRDVGVAPSSNPVTTFWTPNTGYSVGQVIAAQVTSSSTHNFVAVAGGVSGARMPAFAAPDSNGIVSESASSTPALMWTDLGTGTPPGVAPTSITGWNPAKLFVQGSVILYPLNGHYYAAKTGGVSGNTPPQFPVTSNATVTEPPTGQITWEDVGNTAPAGSPASVPQWAANTYFATGTVISDADNGHFFLARQGGLSGPTMPDFKITVKTFGNGLVSDNNLLWQDSGTAPPASVATAGPTDQVVNLLSAAPVPQVHSLSYFNVATGFATNWVRNPTFSWAQTCGTAPCSSSAIQKVRGTVNSEPILLFTTYLPGLAIDAERPWRPRDLVPGLSFGFSMTSPASSFYLGGSFEIWRNLQLATGVNIGKINALAPPSLLVQTPTNTPPVVQRFAVAPFLGVTLNIDFIAGLFGAHI